MLNALCSETMNAVHYVLYVHYHQLEGSVRQKLEIWSCSNLVTLTLSAVLRHREDFPDIEANESGWWISHVAATTIYIHYLKLGHKNKTKTLLKNIAMILNTIVIALHLMQCFPPIKESCIHLVIIIMIYTICNI